MGGNPTEAIECNARSLQELNAYIDRLESPESVAAPFVSRTVQFFKPFVNRKGETVRESLKLCPVTLFSIPPSADLLEREEIATQLIRGIEQLMEYKPMISSQSSEQQLIQPIINRKEKTLTVRSELDKIWEREALNEDLKSSIFGAIDKRLNDRKEYSTILIYNKLMRKYAKLKNKRRRAKRLAGIEDEVNVKLKEKSIPSSLDSLETQSSGENERVKVNIIEAGFHPDLVFFDPSLLDSEREEGISRICGINLSTESDLWLLENIWKVVRVEKQPSVPVVLGRDYDASRSGGFLRIPFNFILSELVDFLEDNLENIRESRRQLLADFVPV